MTNQEPNLDDENLVTVAELTDEVSASIIVAALADEDIKAVATGGFTVGFRAEAPGWVRVKTLAGDAVRAKQIISEIKMQPAKWPDEEKPDQE